MTDRGPYSVKLKSPAMLYYSLMIPAIVAPKFSCSELFDPFGGPKATVEKLRIPELDATNNWFALDTLRCSI